MFPVINILEIVQNTLPHHHVEQDWEVTFNKTKSLFECKNSLLVEEDEDRGICRHLGIQIDIALNVDGTLTPVELKANRSRSHLWSAKYYRRIKGEWFKVCAEDWKVHFDDRHMESEECWKVHLTTQTG